MTRIQLNREQWRLIWATYAVALFIQRDNLREANTATAFLVVGALLLVWRLNRGTEVPADVDARRPVIAIVGVLAALSCGALIVSNWPSSPDGSATSSGAFEVAPVPQVVIQSPGSPIVVPEPDVLALVTPGDLLIEYETNPFSADEKYRGRFVSVVGDVVSVEGGPNEVAFVRLSLLPARRDSTQAMFLRNAEQIRNFKEGDRVTLSCSPEYDSDIDNVMLNDCSLVN